MRTTRFVTTIAPSIILLTSATHAEAASPSSRPQAPLIFHLSEADGTIFAQVFKNKKTIGQGLSHDHVLRASQWQATVSYDPGETGTCSIDVTFPVAALRADEPDMRKRVGYEVMLSDKDRTTVEENMKDKGQLDANRYPTVHFASSGCVGEGTSGTMTVNGTLTIRGQAKAVSVPMTFAIRGEKLSAEGTFTVTHKDFGFAPYSGFLGVVKNIEDIKITIAIGA
jgi:polyisoprenoid-binding protein YceI